MGWTLPRFCHVSEFGLKKVVQPVWQSNLKVVEMVGRIHGFVVSAAHLPLRFMHIVSIAATIRQALQIDLNRSIGKVND